MNGKVLAVRARITRAIGQYLGLLTNDDARPKPSLTELAVALDRLVSTYYSTPDVDPTSEDSVGPRDGEKEFAEAAATAFPELGWYAVADPEADAGATVGLGIATGDLAEIAVDLAEVLWLFENAAEEDAIWQFRWGYQYHWGRHLHEIRLYLHSLAAW